MKITKDMKTNEAVEKYPAIKEVFIKYFGKGCFDCPAFGSEDIGFACTMHGTDVEQFVKECIEAVERMQEE
ncbi:MAG: hypothetical protein A2073_07805 [Deltaproteobacteria bacterium GWC2_42_11]|nr:MAG: hypothetical protein A2073_07805 [Deltaproteobacteria bacterium GWC2_42_11]